MVLSLLLFSATVMNPLLNLIGQQAAAVLVLLLLLLAAAPASCHSGIGKHQFINQRWQEFYY
jgi:hypothetical protein